MNRVKRKVYLYNYKNPKVFYQRKNKKSNKKRIVKKIIKIFILFLFSSGLYFLFSNEYTTIKNINFVNNNNLNIEINKIAKENLSSPKYILFKNNNYFIFNPNKLEEKIKSIKPEIKDIIIKKEFPQTIQIEIVLHQATIGWETKEKKYLLNEEGYILKETDNFEGFIYVKDLNNIPIDKNKQIVYPKFITFIKQVNEKLKNNSIKTSYLEVKETTFMINFYTENGFKIIFNTTKSIEDQIGKLTEAINFLGDNIKNLDYIDVTVKNKAIYKLK